MNAPRAAAASLRTSPASWCSQGTSALRVFWCLTRPSSDTAAARAGVDGLFISALNLAIASAASLSSWGPRSAIAKIAALIIALSPCQVQVQENSGLVLGLFPGPLELAPPVVGFPE